MKKISEILKIVSFDIITNFLLTFVFLSISITSILFIVGIGVSSISFLMYILLSVFVTFLFFYDKKNKLECFKKIIINEFIALIILFITILFASAFYDMTWDGNTYHKEMIGLMKNGMNPVYNVNSGDIWVQHYARAVETFASVIYSFTNNIECGKALNFILIILLFGQVFKYLREKNVNYIFSLIFSFVVAFNPISLIQSVTYYVDGIFANTLFFIILMLLRLTDRKENNNIYMYWLAGLTVVCINIKFTSLLICTMFIGAFVLYWLFLSIKERKLKFELKKWAVYFLCVYIIGVVFVGASVYVKNFLKFGHPFYPLKGEKTEVDIVTDNEPSGLSNYNHVQKFIYTLFSKTYTWYDKKPELKIPFTVYKSEFESMQYADTRIGAFGPLYSGILILSIPIIVFYIIKNTFKRKRENILLFLIILCIIAPIPILPVVWQLRYYPQLYLLPIIALFLLLKGNKNTFKSIYYIIIVFSLFINILLFMPIMFKSFKESININRKLIYLYEQSIKNDLIISIEDCPNEGARYNLQDKNIKYKFLYEKMENGEPMYYRFFYRIEERKN